MRLKFLFPLTVSFSLFSSVVYVESRNCEIFMLPTSNNTQSIKQWVLFWVASLVSLTRVEIAWNCLTDTESIQSITLSKRYFRSLQL